MLTIIYGPSPSEQFLESGQWRSAYVGCREVGAAKHTRKVTGYCTLSRALTGKLPFLSFKEGGEVVEPVG